MACTQDKMIGSWIVNYDDKGLPYWTNDVSEESTYRLLVQQTDQPGMPLKHVGDGVNPPWSLPLTPPPSSPPKRQRQQQQQQYYKKNTRGGDGGFFGGKGKKNKDYKKNGRGGGYVNEEDRGGGGRGRSTRMGCWEELFDSVSGTKVWYNTITHKTTSNDPFF